MKHEEIVTKVRTILNEHGVAEDLGLGEDRVLLNEYINKAIPDAVILLAQKGYWVNVRHAKWGSEDDFPFAENFISLISAKGEEWKKTVTYITEMNSPEYIMSRNEYTKPGVYNPIVFKLGDVDSFDLIAEPSDIVDLLCNVQYDAKDGLNANIKEATAVCYMTAALTLAVFGDDQGKQRLNDIAMNMLQ